MTRPHAGRPPHVPTDESRTLVESLSGFGIPQPNSRAWSASIRRCYGIRSTTDEMRSLDVRRWEKRTFLIMSLCMPVAALAGYAYRLGPRRDRSRVDVVDEPVDVGGELLVRHERRRIDGQ